MAEVPGVANMLEQPIYDTIQLAVGDTTGTLFAVPLGGVYFGTTNKTYAQTNLVQAGRLERGVTLNIDGISLYHPPDATAATIANKLAVSSGRLQVLLGQVEFLTVPVAQIPGGGAELLHTAAATTVTATTIDETVRGVAAISNRFPLRYPIKLEEQETINVSLDNMVAVVGAVINVVVVLWGSYTRPVR